MAQSLPTRIAEGGVHRAGGSIVRRGSSYALRLYAGQEGGTKKYRWLTFRTRTEAEAAQRELAEAVGPDIPCWRGHRASWVVSDDTAQRATGIGDSEPGQRRR